MTTLRLNQVPNTTKMMTGQAPARGKLRFRLQPRDVQIVEAVHRLRVLSSEQIAMLLFGQEQKANAHCRKRLQHLAEAGYLDRREQMQLRSEGRRPYLYFLTQTGSQLLIDELGLEPDSISWRKAWNTVTWPFLRHQLTLNSIYLAFSLAAPRVGWQLFSWTDDRLLRQAHTERFTITGPDGRTFSTAAVPDAHCVFEVPDACQGHTWLQFFIECDLATEVVSAKSLQRASWQRKIRAYQAYFDSVAIQERYKTNRIRVLTVTTSPARMQSLKTATEDEGGRSRYWFTTLDALTPTRVLNEDVWSKAGESRLTRLAR